MSGGDQRAQYTAWLEKVEADGRTPPLEEFGRWWAYDSNLPWRLGSGHLVNLLDQATEALNDARDLLDVIEFITSPQWLADRVLPRMVGAEEMAQLAAIRGVLGAEQEDTWRTVVSENPDGTPSRY